MSVQLTRTHRLKPFFYARYLQRVRRASWYKVSFLYVVSTCCLIQQLREVLTDAQVSQGHRSRHTTHFTFGTPQNQHRNIDPPASPSTSILLLLSPKCSLGKHKRAVGVVQGLRAPPAPPQERPKLSRQQQKLAKLSFTAGPTSWSTASTQPIRTPFDRPSA